MIFRFRATQDNAPLTGLSPSWDYLVTDATGVDKSASAPAITEVGAGVYKFEIDFGTAPWDLTTEGLAGTIDVDPTDLLNLDGSERYVHVDISQAALAVAAFLGHKAVQAADGTVTLYDADGTTAIATMTLANASGVITRTFGAPT